jgi:hypothetical protein
MKKPDNHHLSVFKVQRLMKSRSEFLACLRFMNLQLDISTAVGEKKCYGILLGLRENFAELNPEKPMLFYKIYQSVLLIRVLQFVFPNYEP